MEMVKIITLTLGKKAIVDDDDLPKLSGRKWCAVKLRNTYYAKRGIGDSTQYMHRVIMNTPEGMVIDHINGNGLDNRRENLRIVTSKENLQNLHIVYKRPTTHIRIEIRLKQWMEQNKEDSDTMSDMIKRALVAQSHYDAGEKKPDTVIMKVAERMKAELHLAELEGI